MINTKDYILVETTDRMRLTAITRDEATPESQKRNIRHANSLLIKYLGIIACEVTFNTKYTGEIGKEIIFNNRSYGVKVQKHNSMWPPPASWDCIVYDRDRSASPDRYMFVKVMSDLSKSWIQGFISKDDFWELSEAKPKGCVIGNSKDGTIKYAEADAHHLKTYNLLPFHLRKGGIK